ncbi:MAG: hypothetical protein JJU20_15185 [Opitutales bacterium]|nr:hypothetical protein [Opitutales bacterium]
MPNTPLKPSPLQILSSEFIEISIKSCEATEDHGPGSIDVERDIHLHHGEDGEAWGIMLAIKLEAIEDQPPPPYTGHVVIRGGFRVHEDYTGDPERLIRITAASMLYGATREMLASLTARSVNGMMTLPSVSFFEDLPTQKPATKKRSSSKSSKSKALG